MFGKALSRRQFLEQSVVGGFVAGLGSVPKLSALAAFETASAADGVKLKVIGSAGEGLGVSILYRGHTLAQHNDGGEFSAVFQNGERSLEDSIGNWKATSWSGDATHVALRGACKLNNLSASEQSPGSDGAPV